MRWNVRPASRGYPFGPCQGMALSARLSEDGVAEPHPPRQARLGQAARVAQPRDRAPGFGGFMLPARRPARLAEASRSGSLLQRPPPAASFHRDVANRETQASWPSRSGQAASRCFGRERTRHRPPSEEGCAGPERPMLRCRVSRRLTIPTVSSVHPAVALPVRQRTAVGIRSGVPVGPRARQASFKVEGGGPRAWSVRLRRVHRGSVRRFVTLPEECRSRSSREAQGLERPREHRSDRGVRDTPARRHPFASGVRGRCPRAGNRCG